jgi:enoyl-CoA hydratase
MTDDIEIRTEGRAGRITLNRPQALNALTWDMCTRIEAALDAWASDDAVAMLVIDAAGDKAFCAGGDIAEMYATGTAGDYEYGRRFWADEYRMNAKLFNFPKPVATFLQGFTMGGGVGVGCHASHRIVCDTSRIAMPECGIGLVPDVGGSLILARAPGRLGEYLGVTAARMGPGDAIHAGFADYFVPLDLGRSEGRALRHRRLGGGGPRRPSRPRGAAHRASGRDRRALLGRRPARYRQRAAPCGDGVRR